MRYFEVILVDNIVYAVAPMVTHSLGGGVWKSRDWFDIEILLRVVSLVCRALNIVRANI